MEETYSRGFLLARKRFRATRGPHLLNASSDIALYTRGDWNEVLKLGNTDAKIGQLWEAVRAILGTNNGLVDTFSCRRRTQTYWPIRGAASDGSRSRLGEGVFCPNPASALEIVVSLLDGEMGCPSVRVPRRANHGGCRNVGIPKRPL